MFQMTWNILSKIFVLYNELCIEVSNYLQKVSKYTSLNV